MDRTIEIQTQLTSDSLDDIPREERCITAWVEHSTPPLSPGYAVGSLTECLGDDLPVLFDGGDLELFTVYSCVGATPIVYPCRDDDGDSTVDNGLEMVAGSYATLGIVALAPRAQGVGRTDDGDILYLRPGSVVVQVRDPGGRTVDSSNNLAWWTRHTHGLKPTLNNSSQSSADWTKLRWEIASVERPNEGHLHIFNEPRAANLVNTYDQPQFPVGGGSIDFANTLKLNWAIDIKFDTLGTYVVDFTQESRNNNGTTADTQDDVDHSATGRYTFHVGPVAELEVRDGGSNPTVSASQRAYTIVALNNGPDYAPAVEVTVEDLSPGDSATPTHGEFDPDTGVWKIGELRAPGYYQASGHPPGGPTLTIVTNAAEGREIAASISNTQDYQVCIDSSANDVDAGSETACTEEDSTNTWHTTNYFDYISDNDSATIRAKQGTGADLPVMRGAGTDTSAVIVRWAPIAEVNGRRVTHYEVQRQTNPWVTVAEVAGTTYVDTDVEAGETRRYRVRAVNDWDHKGPWSAPMEGAAPPPRREPVYIAPPPPPPPNAAPVVAQGVPDQTGVAGGQTLILGLSGAFSDPDGHRMTYDATSSDQTVARAVITGDGRLALVPVGAGTALVTLTATDTRGGWQSLVFTMTVSPGNAAPEVTGAIEPIALRMGGAASAIDASAKFGDPDGDELSYTVSSSDPGVVTVEITGSTVTVTPVGVGTAAVTVIAADPRGYIAAQRVTVEVLEAEPEPEPTAAAPADPAPEPSPEPTAAPALAPTPQPALAPTPQPTAAPTAVPTAIPTPTAAPTAVPAPTAAPTAEATRVAPPGPAQAASPTDPAPTDIPEPTPAPVPVDTMDDPGGGFPVWGIILIVAGAVLAVVAGAAVVVRARSY